MAKTKKSQKKSVQKTAKREAGTESRQTAPLSDDFQTDERIQTDEILDLKELDQRIRYSFQGIKRDFTPLDRFNLIKIKVAEIEEELPRLTRTEDAIRTLDKITVKEQALQRLVQELRADIANAHKQADSKIKLAEERIQQMDGKIRQADDKLLQTQSQTQAHVQAKLAHTQQEANNKVAQLGQETNKEFEAVKKDLSYVEAKGGKVVDKRLIAFKQDFTKIAEDLKQTVKEYRNEHATLVKKQQIENLVQDINAMMEEFKSNTGYLTEELSEVAQTTKQVKKITDETQHLPTKVKSCYQNIEKLKEAVAKDIDALKNSIQEIGEKTQKKAESLEQIGATKRLALDDAKTGNGKGRVLSITSHVVIIISFVLLFIAAGLFLAGKPDQGTIDRLLISAILVFVLGIILRIVAYVRK